MKRVLVGVAGVFGLVSCGGSGPEALCAQVIAGDVATVETLLDVSDRERFCQCYQAEWQSRNIPEQEAQLFVLRALREVRETDGLDIEAAAELVEARIADPEQDTGFDFADFELTGDALATAARRAANDDACVS